MAIQNEVNVMKAQVANFLTREQIQDLITALGTDHATLVTSITNLQSSISLLLSETQTVKEQLTNLETRVAALE